MRLRNLLITLFVPLILFLPVVYSSYGGEAFVEDGGFFDGAPSYAPNNGPYAFHETHLEGRRCGGTSHRYKKVVDVMDFGARGDRSDATQAFRRAWKKACSLQHYGPVVLLVPKNNKFLLKPITFLGPCKSTIIMKVQGIILAPKDGSAWHGTDNRHWIMFRNIRHLHIQGGGAIYGNGNSWWRDSCKINKTRACGVAPTALTFYSCGDVRIEDLRIKDSQQIHVSVEQCSDVKISNLSIIAPQESPNTDGIHVAGTKNIHVSNCTIRTGDDCISIVGGSHGILVNNITCGPGHGISVGSLGANDAEDHVSDVVVDGVRLNGTSNGVRIKTWQGGRGYARNITFQNIQMHNVMNPIIIDQNYCDSKSPCHQQKSAVEVSNVKYRNIKGTSATQVAIRFDCSKSVACHGLVVQGIELFGRGGLRTKSFCQHAKLLKSSRSIPVPCG